MAVWGREGLPSLGCFCHPDRAPRVPEGRLCTLSGEAVTGSPQYPAVRTRCGGRTSLTLTAVLGRDLTGKSRSRMNLRCCPARPLGHLGIGSGGPGGALPQSHRCLLAEQHRVLPHTLPELRCIDYSQCSVSPCFPHALFSTGTMLLGYGGRALCSQSCLVSSVSSRAWWSISRAWCLCLLVSCSRHTQQLSRTLSCLSSQGLSALLSAVLGKHF